MAALCYRRDEPPHARVKARQSFFAPMQSENGGLPPGLAIFRKAVE
jgi:hypothetical protein